MYSPFLSVKFTGDYTAKADMAFVIYSIMKLNKYQLDYHNTESGTLLDVRTFW